MILLAEGSQPLLAWLKHERRTNEVELGLMAHMFDLDGALAAGQVELAWRTREVILVRGIELHLRRCGLSPDYSDNHVDRTLAMMRLLVTVAPGVAGEAWGLLLRAAPDGAAALRDEVDAVRQFLRTRLNIVSLGSRGDAMRAWADSTKLLRDIGQSLGVAGSDSWYLSESGASTVPLSWYDEVISLAERQG